MVQRRDPQEIRIRLQETRIRTTPGTAHLNRIASQAHQAPVSILPSRRKISFLA
jgi:hypothetical protein